MGKNKLKKCADEAFKAHENLNEVWVTEDKQVFPTRGSAKTHATEFKLQDPEVFFRKGYAPEVDQDMEDELQASNENVQSLSLQLDKVQDVANVDAEEVPEIEEGDHEAVKAVNELRTRYADGVTVLAEVQEELLRLRQFEAEVVKKVNGDTTKLGQAIIALLPAEITE